MLADFMTMAESSGKPYHALSYCYMGDCRFNMARSLLVTGALLGSDVRLCGPQALWPPQGVRDIAAELSKHSGAEILVTDDPGAALKSVDFVHTDVWVSMGEPKDVWTERVRELRPYRVDAQMLAKTGSRKARFMHPLPAFHDGNTVIGREIMEHTGLDGGLEVSDDVFRSPANIAFDQAENRLHTIKAVLVATLG
jgi:ornithine carbamoyltransferase